MKPSDIEESMLRRSVDLSACTQEFLATLVALRAREQTDVEIIWNAACHINVVEHDICWFLYFTTTTGDVWARRAVARVLATLIYEAVEDLQELLGKKFIDACSQAGAYREIDGAYRASKRKLSTFSKQHVALLKKIRHNAGAHKESDAIDFLAVVTGVDPDKIVIVACDFSTILVELGRFCGLAIKNVNAAYRTKGTIP